MNSLIHLGLDEQAYEDISDSDKKLLQPARVVAEHKNSYELLLAEGPLAGKLSGRFEYVYTERLEWPTVGDFVLVQVEPTLGVIHRVLPRRTQLTRLAPGSQSQEQMIGANIDTVLIVSSLNQDFNPRRLERYLALCRQGGVEPVLVLSKLDLVESAQGHRSTLEKIAPGVPVIAVCATQGRGLEELQPYLSEGQTVALLGSSGVGKSTLVNVFMGGGTQVVQEIRQDDGRGKHTTSHRSLHLLPCGALLMDTPGMRELALWAGEDESQGGLFEDIETLQHRCEFRTCTHESEKGCAVIGAIEQGDLDRGRWQSYLKLKRQQAFVTRQYDARQKRVDKKKWKDISKRTKAARKNRALKGSN